MNQDFAARLKKYRLSESEHSKITQLLGRPPEGVEWALFSALWSEHCSYKSSRVHLKKFAFKSPRVLQAMGENAGVIDLGLGEQVAFKMESHNHPSFIEPYQGAATGVGGILRDIFTMGARPIALANYLCFGDPKAERMSQLVDGVVRGIAGYGNCVGVPTITGQTEFHSSYNNNILVNALAVGLVVEGEPIVTSAAKGVGNFVVYVGAKTGRDGVHGASMASESFAADSASKRPTVQIGDPFFEKLLIESCLQVIQQDLVVAIQDMGAAGLTSSSFEMAAKGSVGLKMHLDQVPLRDASLGPEEILLSESQERMLLICEPKNYTAIQKVFSHWGLEACQVGVVTDGPEVELWWRGERLCAMDPKLLTDNAPIYERPFDVWPKAGHASNQRKTSDLSLTSNMTAQEVPEQLAEIWGTSRRWIYEQYDQRVGAKTVADCGESVGIVRLPKTGRALGLVLGCRPHVMRLDARLGGLDAGLYPALELAAKGFEPLAMTDCLNFGNPEKKQIMSEFVASVDALAEVAKAIDAPVISGNVSFYNETLNVNITSTPATGLVGLRSSIEGIPSSTWVRTGDEIVLWRISGVEFASSTDPKGFVGQIHASDVAAWLKEVREVVNQGGISATRVVGKMGLGYALARLSMSGLGAKVDLGPWAKSGSGLTTDVWTTERLYEVVLVGANGLVENLKKRTALSKTTDVWKIGEVGGDSLILGEKKNYKVADLQKSYEQGWGQNFAFLS